MAKMRVYQLAKELQVQSALILEVLDRMGQEVRSDLSTVERDVAENVRGQITTALEVEKGRLAAERAVQLAEQEKAPAEPAATDAAAAASEEDHAVPAAVAAKAETGEAPETAAARDAESAATAATPKVDAPASTDAPGARQPRVFPARRIPPAGLYTRPRPAPGAGRRRA